jgi:hypothetical protein
VVSWVLGRLGRARRGWKIEGEWWLVGFPGLCMWDLDLTFGCVCSVCLGLAGWLARVWYGMDGMDLLLARWLKAVGEGREEEICKYV